MFNSLLKEFWSWIGIEEESYACLPLGNSLEEYMFPRWDELMNVAYLSIDQSKTSEVLNILTAMAIDHEVENILDYLTEKASDNFVENIICCAATHIQPHARWQSAELIARRRPQSGVRILETFQNDKNLYVRKRASNAYERLCTAKSNF